MRTEDAAALLPPGLAERVGGLPADGGPSGADWLRDLPRTVVALLERWDLDVTGPAWSGAAALVLPVRRGGRRHVLKVGLPRDGTQGEHLALRRWAGDGAAVLAAADPARGGLLLEPLDRSRDLRPLGDEEACDVAGGLLRRLHVPALPRLPTLSAWVDGRLARRAGDGSSGPGAALPPRLVRRAAGLARDLAGRADCDTTLLHTGLHYGNVLAGAREPWLAVDPKPLAGHPGFEVAPLLWTRTGELGTAAALRYLVRRRVDVVCDAAGIDGGLARQWTIVRVWAEAADAAARRDEARVTFLVALAKALDD